MKFLFLSLITVLAFQTRAQTCAKVLLDGPKATETFSQFIRSHPEKFFAFYDGFIQSHPRMQPVARVEGWISGDSHPGQWTFVPNKERYIYTLADFDMAGKGPLVVDFMQYALNVKAIIVQSPSSNKNVRIKEMLSAYYRGLRGLQVEAPLWIKEILDKSPEGFIEKEQRYYRKKLSKKELKLELGNGFIKVAPTERNTIVKTLEGNPFFSNYEIRDVIQKNIDRGGSAGQKRYWVLVTDRNNAASVKIFELKEKQYGILPEADQSSDNMYRYYWDNETHPDYFMLQINGIEFDVRPKKVAFRAADVPYRLRTGKDWVNLEDKVQYDLYLMGLKHASQLNSPEYANIIQRDFNTIAATTKDFIESYLQQFERD